MLCFVLEFKGRHIILCAYVFVLRVFNNSQKDYMLSGDEQKDKIEAVFMIF